MEEGAEEGRSLAETPTYALASVVTFMVAVGFFFHSSLRWTAKWLDRTKRKSLLAALRKIKEELMLFGLLSLLMGHWIESAAKICIKSSVSSRFYPCPRKNEYMSSMKHIALHYSNSSVSRDQRAIADHRSFCPEGHESFASYESLEQIHRLLLVLAVIHVSYSLGTLALAMIKIHSWIKWENRAKAMAIQGSQGCPTREASGNIRIMRLSTFIFHHTSHPWSQHKVLVWLLSFIRQFWSSINRPDYMALRLGFITAHELPLSYDFHNYMLRSMEEEFRDIVGISIPLWIYAIVCIFLDFHGSNIYFWISFLPSLLILLIGTKLHRIIVKLAVEIMDSCPAGGPQFRLRDGLFWLGRPRLLLWLMQFISFQNAFEMATFIWSLWEIRGTSCFMDNRSLLVIRLVFGVVSQFWCSYITFPLYVIVTQMGSSFKKTVISESMRCLLQGWQRRAKRKQHGSSTPLLTAMSVTSLDSLVDGDDIERLSDSPAHHVHDIESLSSSVHEDISFAPGESMESEEEDHDLQLEDEDSGSRVHGYPVFDGHDSELGESVCDEFL